MQILDTHCRPSGCIYCIAHILAKPQYSVGSKFAIFKTTFSPLLVYTSRLLSSSSPRRKVLALRKINHLFHRPSQIVFKSLLYPSLLYLLGFSGRYLLIPHHLATSIGASGFRSKSLETATIELNSHHSRCPRAMLPRLS